MSNLYPGRIEELHRFLEDVYGHRDSQATEILLAGLLPTDATGYERPWVIVETDYLSRDCVGAWFSFGQRPSYTIPRTLPGMHPDWIPCSLASVRVLRPRQAGELMRQWREPALVVEPEWRRSVSMNVWYNRQFPTRKIYDLLLADSLRLRVERPMGPAASPQDAQRSEAQQELFRLAARVLDCSQRSLMDAPRAHVPDEFLYWCELLQRLLSTRLNWERLTGGLSAVARGIAVLRNEGLPDWAAVERLIRDMIPRETGQVLAIAALDRPPVLKGRTGHHAPSTKSIRAEVRRLIREGVIVMRSAVGIEAKDRFQPWMYRLADEAWRVLSDRKEKLF